MVQTVLCFAGALIAAIAVILVVRAMNRGEGPHWAVVLLVLVLAGNVAFFGDRHLRQVATDRQTEHVLAEIESDPVMAAVRQGDPSAYAEIRRIVEDTSVYPAEERADKAKALVGPVVARVVKSRVTHLNDEMVVKLMGMMNEVMRMRLRDDPTHCGMSLGFDQSAMEKAVGQDRMKLFAVDLIRSQPAPAHAAPTQEQFRDMMMQIVPAMAARKGVALGDYVQTMSALGPANQCATTIDLIDYVMQLPQPQAASAFRTLARGNFG